MLCSLSLQTFRKLDKWRTKEEVTGLKTWYCRWTVSESVKKWEKLQQSPDTGAGNASGPWVDPSTVHWSLIRNSLHRRVAVNKLFLRMGKWGEKAEKLDGKSEATGPMKWWILPRAQTSTLLKQCENLSTENRTKGSQYSKKSFGMSFKKPGELFLKSI